MPSPPPAAAATAPAYDSAEARGERLSAMPATNATPEAINARSVADNLNAHDPHDRGRAPSAGKGRTKGRPVRAQVKVVESELGR